MVLLVDEAQVEAHFGLFGDSANLDTREVLGLHQMYHTLRNHFGHARWYYMVKRLKWKLVSVLSAPEKNIQKKRKKRKRKKQKKRRERG
jgi:hypothetical protein